MSEWISVNDRLPERDVEVMTYLSGEFKSLDCMYIALYSHDDKWVETVEDEVLKIVTHWMPLPKPPTQQ